MRQVYVFTTPKNAEKGYLKIGETKKQTVEERVAQQCPGQKKKILRRYVEKMPRYISPSNKVYGDYISDRYVHEVLERAGFEREKIDGSTEWFKCTVKDVDTAVLCLKCPTVLQGLFFDFPESVGKYIRDMEQYLKPGVIVMTRDGKKGVECYELL